MRAPLFGFLQPFRDVASFATWCERHPIGTALLLLAIIISVHVLDGLFFPYLP